MSTRRSVLRLMAIAAGGVAVAGCTPAPAPGAAPGTASAPPATGQPRAGGKLTTARTDDPVSLDGHYFASQSLHTLYGTVYERLVDYDDKLNPQPMLAESWEFSGDAKQLKFSLRKGVTFHTGREFTSDDVKYNLERIHDKQIGAGMFFSYSSQYQSIDTPDKYTAIVNMDPARPALLDLFVQLNMVDRDSVADPAKAVGTGPFTFVQWLQGQSISFAKNKNYWRTGRPYLDEIEIQITTDPQALVTRLETGFVDVISDPPINQLVRLKSDAKWGSLVIRPGYYAARVNGDSQPALADKRVRQALNMAIDRQRYVTTVLQGLSDPVNLPWPSYSEAFEPQKQAATVFNLETAKGLLAQAGVSGLEVELVYRANESAEIGPFAQMWQADLDKIGVKMTIKNLEAGAYSVATVSRSFQIQSSTAADSQYHPVNLFFRQNPPPFVVDQKLVDQVAAEPDLAKRKSLYSQINDLALDGSLDMCFGQSIRATVYNAAKVHGLARPPNNTTLYGDAWLSA